MIVAVVLTLLVALALRHLTIGVRIERKSFEQAFKNLETWKSAEDDPQWMEDTLNHAFDWKEEERWERFLSGRGVAA